MFELYNWIWDRLIPIKEYSVIYGDSNASVGVVCCSIAAHVTAGKSLPDSPRYQSHRVSTRRCRVLLHGGSRRPQGW